MSDARATRRVKDRPRSSKLFGSRYTHTMTSYAEDFAQKRLTTVLAKTKCNKFSFSSRKSALLLPTEWEWPRIMSAYKRSVDALHHFYSRSTYQDSFSGREGERSKLVKLEVPGLSDPSKPQYCLDSTMRSSYQVPIRNEILSVDLMRYGCYKDRRVPARGIVPSLLAGSTGTLGNWHRNQKQRLFKLPSLAD